MQEIDNYLFPKYLQSHSFSNKNLRNNLNFKKRVAIEIKYLDYALPWQYIANLCTLFTN